MTYKCEPTAEGLPKVTVVGMKMNISHGNKDSIEEKHGRRRRIEIM